MRTQPQGGRGAAVPHITDETVKTLQGLAAGHREVVEGLLGLHIDCDDAGLDSRTYALVGVAAVIAVNGPPPEHRDQVQQALLAGATAEDIVSVLVAVGPHVGTSRVITAAGAIMDALGVDPDVGDVSGKAGA
jgi:4-carboxymuconolactone decarboxylase